MKLLKIQYTLCFAVAALLLLSPLTAFAQEIETSETDEEQNQRLNSLEIRLEEMGYVINDVEGIIEQIQTSEQLEQEERLAISDKLDLSIIALNDLVNYNIELLGKADNSETLTGEYRQNVEETFEELTQLSLEQNELTVSGNSIITDFNDSFETNLKTTSGDFLTEFNDTILMTNTLLSYLFVLILILLVMVVVIAFGALLRSMINKFVR